MMAGTSGAVLLGQIEPRESPDAWKIAKARFLDGLNDSERSIFNEATVENLFYCASNDERKDRDESKARLVLGKIQPLVSAIEDYGNAMDTYANIASLYIAPIWGSIRVLLAIANGHSKFYRRIIDTFSRIGDILPRFRDYQRIFDGQKHQRFTHALSMAYLDIIILCTEFKSLLRIQKRSSVRRVFQPLSPALNSHLDDAINRFRLHREAVDKEAGVCHMIEEKESRDLVLRNSEAAEARNREAKQKDLVKRLSKVNYEYKHHRMQKIRHPGTGAWFKELPEFKNWLACETSATMCCYGIPGCGKSVLTSSLIDDIAAKSSPEVKLSVVFYYCDHADKRTLDPVNLFGSIAHQMLRGLELSPRLTTKLEEICQDGKILEVEDLHQLILEAVHNIPSVIIFIDGLDEVLDKDRKLVFSNIRDLIEAAPSVVKVLFASREDTSYLTGVADVPGFRVHIGTNNITEDIDIYVNHAIRALIERKELVLGDPSLADDITTALVNGAKGMFLWVKFQLDDLCLCESDDSIKRVLRDLPRDLSETYDRFLSRVDGAERREFVKRMFNWIICARRPLQVNELREAIAFTINDQQFDAAKIPSDLNRLARACGNLVLIDEETQNVQLAHYTVQQYLLDHRMMTPSFFKTTREAANFDAGELCVAYLSFADFESQVVRYHDDVTPNFAVLENVVATQTLLPPNATGASLAKVITRLRGFRHSSTEINFSDYINVHKKRTPTAKLRTKFTFLSYVVENWLFHTVDFANPTLPSRAKQTSFFSAFDNLAFDKTFSFDIRPWDALLIKMEEYPFMAHIGWALSANHLPLLQAIIRRDKVQISRSLDYAAEWVFRSFNNQSVNHIPENLIIELSIHEQALEVFPTTDEWGVWLHHRILTSSNEQNVEALSYCLMKWDEGAWSPMKAKLFGYLLLEAAIHDRYEATGFICRNISLWKPELQSIVWMTTTCYGIVCNAVELAALSGSEKVMKILASAGCKISDEFKTNVLRTLRLRHVIQDGDIKRLRSLLRIYGASDSSLTNLEIGLGSPEERHHKDAEALSYAILALSQRNLSFFGNAETHWAWSIKDTGCQAVIDLLIAAGAKPKIDDAARLLRDAVEGNRRARIHLLLESKLYPRKSIQYANSFVHLGERSTKICERLRIKAPTEEVTLPILSWAILCYKVEIAELLLLSGASDSQPDTWLGFSALQFTVLAGSTQLFKLVHKHGASLNIRTPSGQDIITFTEEICDSPEVKRAIIDYTLSQDPLLAPTISDENLSHLLVFPTVTSSKAVAKTPA